MVGEPMAFFEAAMLLDTDDCIEWPYGSDRHGYGYVLVNGKRVAVARLACAREHGDQSPGDEAAHGPCNNHACFNRRHVSWKSHADNIEDRKRDGTNPVGVRHGLARLTDNDVREIRRLQASGEMGKDIAARFGISRGAVSNIVNRKRWTHVQ